MMAVRLHKFGAAWGIADPSPFCLKVESFLREADIPYEVVPFDFKRSFAKAPKGKLPPSSRMRTGRSSATPA